MNKKLGGGNVQGWFTTRKQVLTVGVGAALCLFATPAGVLAGTATTVAPNPGATTIIAAGGNTSPADTCGYPNNSSALASVPFNESTVARGIVVNGSGSTATIGVFANDENALLLGINGATADTGSPEHVSNPSIGDPSAVDPSGRPLAPSLYITDITTNPNDTSGDWQHGGTAHNNIADIFGTWATANGTPSKSTDILPSAKNGWNLGAGADTPSVFVTNFNEGYGSEVRWDASSLGLVAGHNYRFQVITHDGDQNKTGGDTGENCTTLTIPAPPTPTYTLAKSVSPSDSPVPIGTPLAYTITLKNTSTVSGDPGVVTDTISTSGGLTYHITVGPAVSAGSFSSTTPGVIDWSPGTLAGGATDTLTYTLVPDATGTVSNTAVNSKTNCPTPGVGVCTTTTSVVNFKLTKSVSPTGPVAVGTPLTYTVTLTNLSSTVAGDPGTINDTASGADGATFSLTSGPIVSAGTASGGPAQFSWTPGTLAGGGVATLQMVLTATSAGTGLTPAIDNTAYGSKTNCPTPGMAGCTTNNPLSNFGLSKTVSPTGTVTIGSTLTYTVTVTNLTSTAGDPGTVNDHITSNGVNYTIVSGPTVSQGSTGGSDPNFTWTPGMLGGSASATATIVLKITGVTSTTPSIDNTAFDTNTNCPTPGVGVCTTHNPVVDFHLSKSVVPTGTVTIGSTLAYTVTITNISATAGDPGTVADNITANGVTYTITSGPTPSQGSVSGSNPSFSWTVGNLAGNASATLTIDLTVTGLVSGVANPSIDNTAFDTVTNCPTPGVGVCTTHNPVEDFHLAKTVSPTGAVTVGSTLTYTVTVTNLTAAAGNPGQVSDKITSNGVTYTITSGPTPSQGSVSGSNPNFTWLPGTVAGNSSATVTIVLKVTGATAGTVNPSIENTAFDTNTNCPVPNIPECTPNTPLVVLTLTKTVDKTTAALNDTLTYTITVGNTGSAPATNVLVDDIFGGDAGFLVNDGTNGTTNSFAGSPAITVTKLANGHYQWTYPSVAPGDLDTVTFTAVIQLPGTVLANTSGTITLTNTVSVPSYHVGINNYNNPGNNPPPVTVSTVAPYHGGQQGCSTSTGCGTPNTGAHLNVTLAGFLFLGGIGLILVGILARKPEETIS